MTWAAYDGNEPIVGSESDDPGMCMLFLMRYHPSAVGRDFTDWVVSRRTRMESAVKALMDPHVADRLKEGYLNYVTYYATDTGIYFVADTDIEIREVAEDAES